MNAIKIIRQARCYEFLSFVSTFQQLQYGVNISLQLIRYSRACIFPLYFLGRGLFFTLIVTDKVYSRHADCALISMYTSYYFLSTSNSNKGLRLRGCSAKLLLSLSQFDWSIRIIDLTDDRTYVPLFIKLYQPLLLE